MALHRFDGQALPGRFRMATRGCPALLSGRFAAASRRSQAGIMRKKQHNRSKPCLILRLTTASLLSSTGILHLAITRRHLLQSGAFAALAPALGIASAVPAPMPPRAIRTGEPAWRHALSLFGDIKYPADFKRFDYVNPDAPKGGIARQIVDRHVRQFQHRGGRRERLDRSRRRADLRIADDAVAGRGLDRIRRCWPRRSAIPRIFPR